MKACSNGLMVDAYRLSNNSMSYNQSSSESNHVQNSFAVIDCDMTTIKNDAQVPFQRNTVTDFHTTRTSYLTRGHFSGVCVLDIYYMERHREEWG